MCIYQTKTCAYLLVVSNPSSNGHFCLVVVDALVGGQQSNESQTGSHHSSVKGNEKGYVNASLSPPSAPSSCLNYIHVYIRLFVSCNSEIDWPSDRSSWSFSFSSCTERAANLSEETDASVFHGRSIFTSLRISNFVSLTSSLNFISAARCSIWKFYNHIIGIFQVNF